MHSILRLFLMACLVLVTAGPHVVAQNDDALRNPMRQTGTARNPLEWLFGNRQRATPAAPKPVQRTYQPRTRSAVAARPHATETYGPPMPPEMQPAQAQPQVADGAPPAPVVSLQIAVIGDSLAGMLAQGLQEIYADRPTIAIQKRFRDSSGLVRDDYYDWPKALRELLAGNDRLDAVVVMVGSNDRQQLRDDQGVHEPRSEKWRELYTQRIDDLIAIARERKTTLIWVGLPVMRTERYSADMLAFNEIYRARTAQANVPFVDVWEAFSTEQGDYTATGPDIGGDVVRLRTSDGVHFTKAGARKLAFFADRELQKIVAAAQARIEIAGLPKPAGADPSAPTQPQKSGDGLAMIPVVPDAPLSPALRSIDSILGIPVPDRPPPVPLQPRPAAGPVITLTAPPVTPGGVLWTANAVTASADAARVFVEGLIPASKPGRADDFRLP